MQDIILATTNPPAAGWYHDPACRFTYRYWTGTQWTEQVSSEGRTACDPVEVDAVCPVEDEQEVEGERRSPPYCPPWHLLGESVHEGRIGVDAAHLLGMGLVRHDEFPRDHVDHAGNDLAGVMLITV